MNVQMIALAGLTGALAVIGGRTHARVPPDWTLREELRVGGRPGPEDDLPPIAQVTVGHDGALYVLARSGEIVVVDRTGSAMRRFRGSRNSGLMPEARERSESAMSRGETAAPLPTQADHTQGAWSGMGWLGDTLWLLDRVVRRVDLLSPNGGKIGVIPFTAGVEGGRSGIPFAVLSDRSLLRGMVPYDESALPPRPEGTPTPGPYRMPIIPPPPPRQETELPIQGFLVRAAPDGRVLQGLEIVVDPRPAVTVRSPYGSFIRIDYPFQDNPLIGVTPDGAEVVFVERYAAVRPGLSRYSVARFDVATRKRSARPFEYAPAPLTTSTVDSLLASIVDSPTTAEQRRFVYGFPSSGEARAAIRAALDLPAFHAPVTEMLVGADRTVWLRERATGRWLAHTPDGQIAGRISVPRGARLLFADAETVWVAVAVAGEASSRQALVRYRLVKS